MSRPVFRKRAPADGRNPTQEPRLRAKPSASIAAGQAGGTIEGKEVLFGIPAAAEGSLVDAVRQPTTNAEAVGSALIGQEFTADRYLWGRLSAARGIGSDAVRTIVARHTSGRQFGLLGEPRVKVLLVNLARDAVL